MRAPVLTLQRVARLEARLRHEEPGAVLGRAQGRAIRVVVVVVVVALGAVAFVDAVRGRAQLAVDARCRVRGRVARDRVDEDGPIVKPQSLLRLRVPPREVPISGAGRRGVGGSEDCARRVSFVFPGPATPCFLGAHKDPWLVLFIDWPSSRVHGLTTLDLVTHSQEDSSSQDSVSSNVAQPLSFPMSSFSTSSFSMCSFSLQRPLCLSPTPSLLSILLLSIRPSFPQERLGQLCQFWSDFSSSFRL